MTESFKGNETLRDGSKIGGGFKIKIMAERREH
jgi:hypothetical protein